MGCAKSQELVLQSTSNNQTINTPVTQISNNHILETKNPYKDMKKPIQKIFDFLTTLRLFNLNNFFHTLKHYSKQQKVPKYLSQNRVENNELNLPKTPEINFLSSILEISLISKPITRPLSLNDFKRSIKKSKTQPLSQLSSYIFKPKPSVPKSSQLYAIVQQNLKNAIPPDFYEIINEYNMKQAPRYLIDPSVDLDQTDNLTLPQILTFFDEMLEKKLSYDEKVLKNNEKPKEILPFLLEYLEEINDGIKLPDVFVALNQYAENSYIKVIKRLLGIGQKDVGLHFTVFLCKARAEFKNFVKEKSKIQKDLQKFVKKGKKGDKKTFVKTVDEHATLFSIFEYARRHFTSTLVYVTLNETHKKYNF